MAIVTGSPQRVIDGMSRDSRRIAVVATLLLTAGGMLLAQPGVHSALAYWAASAIALVGALALIVAGVRAWDHVVDRARADGVIAP